MRTIIYIYRVGERRCVCSSVRRGGSRRRKKELGDCFFISFRLSPYSPFPVFDITIYNIYKPAPAKTRHSTAPGPEVFAHCSAAHRGLPSSVGDRDLSPYFLFFFFLSSSSRTHNGYPAATTTTTIGR